jgi:hypothetical protein
MYDVFLSHNRQHKAWVRELCRLLRGEGLKVFFDEDSIDPGENVVRAIERAIEASRHVILVATHSSMASEWVAMETALSIYKDPAASKTMLLPVMLEKLEPALIPLSLRALNYIDLTDLRTRDREFARLLKCLGLNAEASSHMSPPLQAADGAESYQPPFLTVADIDNVISWGWDGQRLLDELIKLDYQTIEGLTPDHEGHAVQWAPVFMDHPDTWRLLITGPERIVGYWHFVPLFNPEYQEAKQGLLSDGQITTDIVRVMELPGWYDIYFVSICVQPIYRRTPRMRLLYKAFFDVMMELALEGVFIKEVCANAYTRSGEALCKDLGFNFLTNHVDHGKIYLAQFSDLLEQDISKNYHDLRRLYGSPSGARNLRLV